MDMRYVGPKKLFFEELADGIGIATIRTDMHGYRQTEIPRGLEVVEPYVLPRIVGASKGQRHSNEIISAGKIPVSHASRIDRI